MVERSYGSFSRAIPLPFDPDPTKVEAKFDKGVLHIHLPKPAEVAKKQQKIEIKKARSTPSAGLMTGTNPSPGAVVTVATVRRLPSRAQPVQRARRSCT